MRRLLPIFAAVSGAAFAGTHSTELDRMSSSRQVDVIFTYDAAQVALIVGGDSRKIASLPGGELRRTTAGDAVRLSTTPGVANVTVNHQVVSTGTTAP